MTVFIASMMAMSKSEISDVSIVRPLRVELWKVKRSQRSAGQGGLPSNYALTEAR